MTTRADLIRRLEEATEGSQELDEAIAVLDGWEPFMFGGAGRCWRRTRDGEKHIVGLPPRYTRSVDAALTLVPERGDGGFLWRLFIERKPLHSGPPWFVTIREHAKDGASAVAYTAPLAICAAALQLRQGDRPS